MNAPHNFQRRRSPAHPAAAPSSLRAFSPRQLVSFTGDVHAIDWSKPDSYSADVLNDRRSLVQQGEHVTVSLAEWLQERRKPTFGEKLVSFFREHGEAFSFWFAMSTLLLVAVCVVAAVDRSAF